MIYKVERMEYADFKANAPERIGERDKNQRARDKGPARLNSLHSK